MLSINSTQVLYNRKQKQWEAVNGQTVSFPAGKEGKRAALRYALAVEAPALYAVVDDIISIHGESNAALLDRLLKAAQLILADHVYQDNKVKSQSGEEVYQVSFVGLPHQPHCTCPDFERGLMRRAGQSKWGGAESDYGLVCKHVLAVLLVEFANLQPASQPIPF